MNPTIVYSSDPHGDQKNFNHFKSLASANAQIVLMKRLRRGRIWWVPTQLFEGNGWVWLISDPSAKDPFSPCKHPEFSGSRFGFKVLDDRDLIKVVDGDIEFRNLLEIQMSAEHA